MNAARCEQPGCGGTIDGGFCDRCGLEPTGAVALAADARGSAVSATLGTAATGTFGSSASGRAGSSRRGSGSVRTSTRKHLGLGLVTVPGLPAIDPATIVMAVAEVPPHKRFCPNPDCHDAAGGPTPLTRRLAGHCPECGAAYSFVPTLKAGDVVADQYEVAGPIAYGGLGWIYLATDRALGRWVVLKGLLNSGDAGAAAAAVAERQFLASVKHPNIVGVYTFAKRGGGSSTEGFIVMEYVGGQTLKDVRKGRGPLPAAEAIAYVHRILGAFAYLHERGMVYCDFKPDNVMVEGDPPDVKLIDMGGVRLIDDPAGDIYGTQGYMAPEAKAGPTAASDLYTVGRTLAVLLMEFRFQSVFEHALPPAAEQPVLARYESLQRFLLRATHADPDRRFGSADEMADQLAGVLREVVAGTVPPKAVESAIFGGDPMLTGDAGEVIPAVKIDPDDPGAGVLLSTVHVADLQQQAKLLQNGLVPYPESAELRLRSAAVLIRLGQYPQADRRLNEVVDRNGLDWRVEWYRGLLRLARGEPHLARDRFDRVYSDLPGEPAVKLAVAVAAEKAGDDATATRLYDLVGRTDPTFASAAFGLARCLARAGRRAEAAAALRRVSAESTLHGRAQVALARLLIDTSPTTPGAAELCEASAVVDALGPDNPDAVRLRAEVFENALSLLESKAIPPDAGRLLFGSPLVERPVRFGLEKSLRQLARNEPDRATQVGLVDLANRVRPRTLV